MEVSLIDKKLLILGANPETVPLVQYANDMGVLTLVTSNRPDDPAKKFAWKALDIDGLDVPELIALIKREGVDGVLPGVADVLVPTYCKVCDTLGLPCYATQEIVDIFSCKDVFKATCERFGVHGVPEYYLDADLRESDIAKIKFPVMVKPVDSCSGQGMTVCYRREELKAAVDKALAVSRQKRFIVEKYMQCDDMGFYYTFKDGICGASCVYDRYTTDEQPGLSRVCLGGTYPSKHIQDYFRRMHDNICRMFRSIGIRDGVLLLSAFYEGGEFYVYDPGFRLQGEAPHLLMRAVHGFDQREMLIRLALGDSGEELDTTGIDDPYFRGKWAATLWFLSRAGTIRTIHGLENATGDSRVAANVQRLREGDTVLPDWVGTEKQVVSRLYLVCDSKQALAEALEEYMGKVRVRDTEGKDLLLRGFDVRKALELHE